MGLDNYTAIIYGWKVKGEKKVEKFSDELEKINEDWYDEVESIVILDNMCGNYAYFGAILDRYDADEGGEVVVNNKLVDKATSKYNKFINDHPDYKAVFDKYSKNIEPQLYIFQDIY